MKRLVILAVLCFIMFSSSALAISIGVSPGRVQYRNVLANGYAERTVRVSTNSDLDLTGHYEVRGDIQEWLRFEPGGDEFVISQDSPHLLTIIIEPPADIRNGSYEGKIEFVTDRFGNLTSRAGGLVRAAVTLIVDVEVINQEILACRAGAFDIKDAEINFPIEFSVTVINDGNVRINPQIEVDIWDQLQQNLVASKELSSTMVLPTVEGTTVKELTEDLAVGQYWATVAVEECQASELLTFSIVDKGEIADQGVLKEIRNAPWVETGDTVEIEGVFQNNGQRAVFAVLKGTIKLDNEIVKIIETEELEVRAGQTQSFITFFTPEFPGRYVIGGRVVYNKKMTYERGSILNVNDPEKDGRLLSLNPLLMIYLAIIITIIFIARKIVKEKKKHF